jgi:glycosyltransferase involved in cell wall biosynthesis
MSTTEPAPHVSVVLPCYNEEAHVLLEVERIVKALEASGYTYELLVIDDASTDDSLRVLREAAPSYPYNAARSWCGPTPT